MVLVIVQSRFREAAWVLLQDMTEGQLLVPFLCLFSSQLKVLGRQGQDHLGKEAHVVALMELCPKKLAGKQRNQDTMPAKSSTKYGD